MGRPIVTEAAIHALVARLQELHPPLRLAAADFSVRHPGALRERFAAVFDFLARVELEVDRNVLELLTVMPQVSEVDRFFYQDVWQPQEIAHGMLLDTLQTRLGLPPADPSMHMTPGMRALGMLAHIPAIQEVARFLYYLTGASTEREAVVAYSALTRDLTEMGEDALRATIIHPIKQQEPGHYAFYQMSASRMMQEGVLAPWQLYLVRVLRSRTFEMVGTRSATGRHHAQMGELMERLGFADSDEDLARFAGQISRLEMQLLWAHRRGMQFPPYVLRAMRDCVDRYRAEVAAQA